MDWAGFLPGMLADTPAGIQARRETLELPVMYVTAQQHSPATAWNQGSPYPGPPATVQISVDYDSARWWGRTGQGQLTWSSSVVFSANLPPALPWDLPQHIDVWQDYMGGYPSIARTRPTAFGDLVPVLRPS